MIGATRAAGRESPCSRRLPVVTNDPRAKQPSAVELQAEIEAARDNLTATLEQLKAETRPKALVQHGINGVKGFFTDEYGGIEPKKIVIAAGAVVGLVLAVKWRRSRRHCHCH